MVQGLTDKVGEMERVMRELQLQVRTPFNTGMTGDQEVEDEH